MPYTVRITGRGQRDFDKVIAWLADRSLDGAIRLERAFDDAIERLASNPLLYSHAPERELSGLDVRQIFFKTKRGRPYRALFVVQESDVWILHVRGTGQNLLEEVVPPSPEPAE